MAKKKRINLLPRSEFESSFTGKFVSWAIAVGRRLLVLTELVVVCAFLSRFYFDTKLDNLFEEVKQKKTIVNSVVAFEDTFKDIQTRSVLVKNLLNTQTKPSAYFLIVNRHLPQGVTLTQISVDGVKITVSGISNSETAIDTLINEIMGEPKFKEVSINNIARKETDPTNLSFTLSGITN